MRLVQPGSEPVAGRGACMDDLAQMRDHHVTLVPGLGPESFRDAVCALPEFAVYVLRIERDGSALFESANQGVQRLVNCPVDEICGRPPRDCLPAEVADCLETNLVRCLASRAPVSYDRALNLPEGRMTWTTTLMPVPSTRGGTRHVLGLTRDITFEAQALGKAEKNEALLEALRTALPNTVYLLDVRKRTIRFIGGGNDGERQARMREVEEMGDQFLYRLIHPDDLPKMESHMADLATLGDDEISAAEYRVLNNDGECRQFITRKSVFSRDAEGRVETVLGVSEDVTEQSRTFEELHRLSDRLLTLQMDERRRIAEELHDSTAQHLTAVGLALARIWPMALEGAPRDEHAIHVERALVEAQGSLEEAKREIRVLSYLLHPPALANQGLSEAIRSFATGFGTRAGLDVETRIDRGVNQLSEEMKVAFFRICQEALANVHNHANASKVFVALELGQATVTLKVLDDGIGVDEETLETGEGVGVGLSGMSERMVRLGGSLKLHGRDKGACLVASAPLRAA